MMLNRMHVVRSPSNLSGSGISTPTINELRKHYEILSSTEARIICGLCDKLSIFANPRAVKEVVEAAREVAEKGWWDGERLITDRINRLQKALESLDKEEA